MCLKRFRIFNTSFLLKFIKPTQFSRNMSQYKNILPAVSHDTCTTVREHLTASPELSRKILDKIDSNQDGVATLLNSTRTAKPNPGVFVYHALYLAGSLSQVPMKTYEQAIT